MENPCEPAAKSPMTMSGQKAAEILKVTENARSKLIELMKRDRKTDFGLKLKVMKGGCAGYTYWMDFEKEPAEEDIVIEEEKVKVFLDKNSLEAVKGTTIDYFESLQGSGFILNNPNVKGTCHCGHSFR